MHFTQNPIGSDDQLDLQDNAIALDYAMNSPAALWQDRFGKQHKTVQQALKDVGFKPAGFDFVSGGTLGIGDRDKCVFYPTDGYWYSWNGKLPYVVPANSSPTPAGKRGWGPMVLSPVNTDVITHAGSKAGMIEKTLRARYESASIVDFATEYLTETEIAKIRRPYPGKNQDFNKSDILDITDKLVQAITNLGGTGPSMEYRYLHSPSLVLRLPAGVLGVNFNKVNRILIAVSNIIIEGAGAFNTRIVYIGSEIVPEMFRFKGAYCCGIQHLTLDGGLPLFPVGDETYGIETPLVLDQVAHFYSEDLHICNYRHRGLQCIHLWESWFGSLRIAHGGWFRNGVTPPGGVFFDNYGQEEHFFPGSESNQVWFDKIAVTCIGRVLDFTSPCFNVVIGNLVSENFTLREFIPAGTDHSKIFISGLSVVTILSAWHYYHDERPAVPSSTIFEIFNPGPGCVFDNQNIFQQAPLVGENVISTPNILSLSNTYPVEINMAIDDRGSAKSKLFNGRREPSQLIGKIKYTSVLPRTVEDFLGGESLNGFTGNLSFHAGEWENSVPEYYEITSSKANKKIIAIGEGWYKSSSLGILAFISLNGVTGDILFSENINKLSKIGVGEWEIEFKQPMPDNNYIPSATIVKLSHPSDSFEIGSKSSNKFSFAIRDYSGARHDSPNINIVFFR